MMHMLHQGAQVLNYSLWLLRLIILNLHQPPETDRTQKANRFKQNSAAPISANCPAQCQVHSPTLQDGKEFCKYRDQAVLAGQEITPEAHHQAHC